MAALSLWMWIFFSQAAFMVCAGDKKPKVLIVGGGISGLGAAVRLLDHGFTNIKILEAENRIGGRVKSVPVSDWNVDIGAHWVHGGEGNQVYEIAEPLGLVEESGDGTHLITVFSDGKVLAGPIKEKGEDLSTLRNISTYHALYNGTKAKLAELVEAKYVEPYTEHVLKMLCPYIGCDDLKEVSAGLTDDYLHLNSSFTFGWKGKGYGSIIDLILRRHEKSKGPEVSLEGKLVLGSEVKKIHVKDDGVVVTHGNGEEEKADIVLVTVSVGVLKAGTIQFQPLLPQPNLDAIKAIGFGTIDKVILRFPTIWWPTNSSNFMCVWLPEDKAVKPGETWWEKEILGFGLEAWSPTTMTAWLIGEAAREMEKAPLEEVTAAVMRALDRFFGSSYTIPRPVEVLRSTWGTNPHFRGSYSFRTILAETHNVSHIRDPITNKEGKQVMFFAGEATHRHFYGTVHGALDSGWREAERINSLYK